jgi:hypothetical protein
MKLFATIILLFGGFTCYCQEINNRTYKIINLPKNTDIELYINAINNSDLQCFRFKSTCRVLNFKSGLSIEIFSYNKLIADGLPQTKDCFLKDGAEVIDYQFDITNNIIIAAAPNDKSIK